MKYVIMADGKVVCDGSGTPIVYEALDSAELAIYALKVFEPFMNFVVKEVEE